MVEKYSEQRKNISMLSDIKKLFMRPSILEVVTAELAEAEHAKLAAQSAVEYAESMVAYNDKRVLRLIKRVNALTQEQKEKQ